MTRLERPIYTLLRQEPFFAHFLLGCRIIFDDPRVKTAGVTIVKGEIRFLFCTEWFFKHTPAEQVAVLKHEVLHLLLEHCGGRGKAVPNKMAANVAMDCAINQHIADLPEGCVTLKTLEELVKKTLLPLQAWEYYYNEMKEAVENSTEQHDHDVMQEGEPSDMQDAQNRIAVKDAAAKAINAAAGNVSESLNKVLGELNKAAKLPWKQLLRNFVSSARSTKNKSTRMKPNRRFELDQPGRKKIRELVLGVCTDSSGSVSDESYAAFMTEIQSIIKGTSITYLIHADSEIQKIDIIRGGKAKPGVLTERHGGGGTAYQPAIDACMKLKCDAIIYFGDMDASDVPTNPGIPFIWVRVGTSPTPGDFGKVLDI